VALVVVQGRIMADTAMESKDTPLQEKLELLATRIGYFGFVFAILTFAAMIASWYINKENVADRYNTSEWYIHAIITSVTIIVVAIPEGLVRGRCSVTLHCVMWGVDCRV
jgi:Ca2+-transporting ATPase